ncbi:MAG: putative sulfate exporter family transporter [bacterium]|nr:putative sulfate exporter family transporter [bacterium]
MSKTSWNSPLIRSEDWVSVWLGAALILLAIVGVRPVLPSFSWSAGSPGGLLSADNVLAALVLGLLLMALSAAGLRLMGGDVRAYVVGFAVLFGLGWASQMVAGIPTLKEWGISYVIVSLVVGLVISNLGSVPPWMKEAVRTEYYIKTGLVILGSSILFGEILRAGLFGLGQALLVILVVWRFCYWFCRRIRVDKEFSVILATAVSICGVSAAIAACGAVGGDRKKLSYVTSLVLIVAAPMAIFMPAVAESVGLAPVVAGAWLGGTIDTSGAVVASGEILGDSALNAAVIVKFSQNALLGLAAFAISLWWVFRGAGDREERPTVRMIWDRFPKFVLGFMVVSLLFSFLLSPDVVDATGGLLKGIRTWWFSLAFLCIGLETRFRDLVSMDGGRPAAGFLVAQGVNILWTLGVAWLLFGGVLFSVPDL